MTHDHRLRGCRACGITRMYGAAHATASTLNCCSPSVPSTTECRTVASTRFHYGSGSGVCLDELASLRGVTVHHMERVRRLADSVTSPAAQTASGSRPHRACEAW